MIFIINTDLNDVYINVDPSQKISPVSPLIRIAIISTFEYANEAHSDDLKAFLARVRRVRPVFLSTTKGGTHLPPRHEHVNCNKNIAITNFISCQW